MLNIFQQAYGDWCGPRRKANQIAITREEWCQWWIDNKQFANRGNRIGCANMYRIDTALPFSLDNIELRIRGKKQNDNTNTH